MKIVVFGATGKTGELAWQQAVAAGHSVTVFGRSVEKRYASEQIAKVQGDVLEPGAVSRAIANQDAVLVCLGPPNTKDTSTLTTGATHIKDAMIEHNVKRVIFISAAGVEDSWQRIPWYSKLLFSTLLKTILAGHAREEAIFSSTNLDWTALRAAVLTSKPATEVVASNTVATKTVSRAALAKFMVEQLLSKEYLKQAICITST